MPTNQYEDIHTYVHVYYISCLFITPAFSKYQINLNMLNECTYMHKYIVHVHVWLFLKIVQLNSLIMSYVHQLGIWSSDY
jgi:hypothetical protein